MANPQSRKMSLVESISNQVLAFAISVAASFIIFPLLGVQMNAWQNLATVTAFSVISIIRSYCVRRAFERLR